jgi:hypothetical protein
MGRALSSSPYFPIVPERFDLAVVLGAKHEAQKV